MATGDGSARVRVVVADDHPIFREGMVRALASTDTVSVVGEADNGAAAWELIQSERPDVALLDFRMPLMDGAQIAAAAQSADLATRVLLLSAHNDAASVYHALQHGAAGFISKESSRPQIVAAVMECASGRDVVSPALATSLAAEIRRRAAPAHPALSAREHEVLQLIAAGKSLPAIAADMFLATSTVRTHAQRLYDKLGVTDRAAAVAEGMRRGLLQ